MRIRRIRNARHMRGRRSYTSKEIAKMLGVHPHTVRIWHKNGMTPIDPLDRPLLFLGSEIKRFLTARRQARKVILGPDQFYCPRCRAARNSNPGDIQVGFSGKRIGRDDESIIVQGVCQICSCRLFRFSTKRRWQARTGVTPTEADSRLYGDLSPAVNADFGTGENRDGK